MSRLNCVDMSRWGGELTPSEAACMAAQGVHTVIVATGPGGYGLLALQQAEAASAAGMRVEAYVFLEFESEPEWWVQQALWRLEDFPVARWWLDIEDTEHGRDWHWSRRRAYAQRALEEFGRSGIFAHIYTGGWYWRPYMGDWLGPASEGRLLWNSYYDGDPDVEGLPYGGWTKETVAIEQYQGTTDLCGQSVDLNAMYIDPQEAEVADPRLDEVIKALGGIEAIRAWNERGNSLLLGYEREQVDQNKAEEGLAALDGRVAALEARPAPGGAIDYERLAMAAELGGKAAAASIRNLGQV